MARGNKILGVDIKRDSDAILLGFALAIILLILPGVGEKFGAMVMKLKNAIFPEKKKQ